MPKMLVSTHPGTHNKDNKRVGYGWGTGTMSSEQIIAHLTSGKAISVAALKSGHRDDDNFVSSQLVAVDFDKGPGVQELAKDDFINEYAFLVMTTSSSTPENPRCRAFFALDKPIGDGNLYKEYVEGVLYRFLTKGFVIDGVCTSCTQVFFGNSNSEYLAFPEKVLPASVLMTLPTPPRRISTLVNMYKGVEIEFDNESPIPNDPPVRDLLTTGGQVGSRDNDATRLVGKYINLMSDADVEEIMRLWWNQLPDKTDFPFETIQSLIKRLGEKSGKIRSQVQTIVRQDVQTRTGQVEVVPVKDKIKTLITPFQEFMGEEPTVNWMIKDWLPEATTGMMVAPPSHFKTWIALTMAMCVGQGKPLFGTYPTNGIHRVMVMQQEDPQAITRQRSYLIFGENCKTDDPPQFNGDWIDTGIVIPQVDYWTADKTFRFDDQEVMRTLLEIIKERSIKLVLIDPLYAATDSADYMSKDAQRMVELKRYRDATGCSFMLLHHTKKSAAPATGPGSNGRPNRLDAWGSQFLNAWIETGIQIRSTDDPKSVAVMRHFKSSGETFNDIFTFDINTDEEKGERKYIVTSKQAEEKGTGKVDVLDIFDKFGPMSISDFAKKAGVAVSTASRRLNKMVDKGVLGKKGDGIFFVISSIDVELMD